MNIDLMKSGIGTGTLCVLLVAVVSGVWTVARGWGDVETHLVKLDDQFTQVNTHFDAVQRTLEEHSGQMRVQADSLSVQTAVIDKISNKQDQVAAALSASSAQQTDMISRINPTRWTFQMQQEFERELEQHFQYPDKVGWPDVKQIHDEFQSTMTQ